MNARRRFCVARDLRSGLMGKIRNSRGKMTKIKIFLKDIFGMKDLQDKDLYFLLGIFSLVLIFGMLGVI